MKGVDKCGQARPCTAAALPCFRDVWPKSKAPGRINLPSLDVGDPVRSLAAAHQFDEA
jgi:hypothetical protein